MKAVAGLDLRLAGPDDAAVLHQLICDLACYEQMETDNISTVDSIRAELADEHGELEAVLAEKDGTCVAMATFFRTYSTFKAKRGIYLEDLYVHTDHRHLGVGAQLMQYLCQLAIERGYARIEWTALMWNTQAIEFYERLGASPSDAWTTFRLDGEWLKKLADSE
ncbi:MAG: GNAT family N-acetyltransferase [Planctomycetes bacterium]|nr:GNAT family N-acetyltransferase [Planctomycetota bacterium]